jgi:hypothetical protein
VIAVDAGPMQIQWWEGAALSRAETVLQGTTHDTVDAEIKGVNPFLATRFKECTRNVQSWSVFVQKLRRL